MMITKRSVVLIACAIAVALTGCPPGGDPVDTPPGADFTGAPTSGEAPLLVNFTDTSAAGSKPITEWQWDFGDGGTNAQQHPQHTYTDVGTYDVSLTVTSSAGSDTKTITSLIVVTEPAGDPPVAAFTAEPTSGPAPLKVQFTDTSTSEGTAITAWSWDFGDGGADTAQHPAHVYEEPGTYSVSLTVTSADGSDKVTETGLVVVTETPPFTLHINPADPVILTAKAETGEIVEFYGDRDSEGVPEMLTGARVTFAEGASDIVMDEMGRPVLIANPDGSAIKYEWLSDTEIIVTAIAADGVTAGNTGVLTLEAPVSPLRDAGFSDAGVEKQNETVLIVPATCGVAITDPATRVSADVVYDLEGRVFVVNYPAVHAGAGVYELSVPRVPAQLTTEFGVLCAATQSVIEAACFSAPLVSSCSALNAVPDIGPQLAQICADAYDALSIVCSTNVANLPALCADLPHLDRHITGFITIRPSVYQPWTGIVKLQEKVVAVSDPLPNFVEDLVGDAPRIDVSSTALTLNNYGAPKAGTVVVLNQNGAHSNPCVLTWKAESSDPNLSVIPPTGNDNTKHVTLTWNGAAAPATDPVVRFVNVSDPSDYVEVIVRVDIRPPVAAFIATTTTGYAPLHVLFTDRSTPTTAPIATYAWDFGDGGVSSDRDPAHTYTTPGTYHATLTVTAQDGPSDQSDTMTIEVDGLSVVGWWRSVSGGCTPAGSGEALLFFDANGTWATGVAPGTTWTTSWTLTGSTLTMTGTFFGSSGSTHFEGTGTVNNANSLSISWNTSGNEDNYSCYFEMVPYTP